MKKEDIKITDDILLKNDFKKEKTIKGHDCFCCISKTHKMKIYKNKDGQYLYPTIGVDFQVKFLSEINEYYKNRIGKDLIH